MTLWIRCVPISRIIPFWTASNGRINNVSSRLERGFCCATKKNAIARAIKIVTSYRWKFIRTSCGEREREIKQEWKMQVDIPIKCLREKTKWYETTKQNNMLDRMMNSIYKKSNMNGRWMFSQNMFIVLSPGVVQKILTQTVRQRVL